MFRLSISLLASLLSATQVLIAETKDERWTYDTIETVQREPEKIAAHGLGVGLRSQGVRIFYNYNDDVGLNNRLRTQYEFYLESNFVEERMDQAGRTVLEDSLGTYGFLIRQVHSSGLHLGLGMGLMEGDLYYSNHDNQEKITYSRVGTFYRIDLGWQSKNKFYVSLGINASDYFWYNDSTTKEGSASALSNATSYRVDNNFSNISNRAGDRDTAKRIWKNLVDPNRSPFYIGFGWYL